MGKPARKERITHLDALRGVAILAVIFFHSFHRWNDTEPYQQFETISLFSAPLWLGVELFFAISGFVIFMSLERSKSFFQFGLNRWLRLFPAMLIATVFVLVALPLFPFRPAGIPNIVDIIPGLTFVHPQILSVLSGIEMKSLEGVFWSLYVEVIFYAVAATAFFMLRDKRLLTIVAIYLAQLALLIVSLLMPENQTLLFAREASFAIGFTHYGWFLVGIFAYAWHRDANEQNFLIAAIFGILATAQLAAEQPNDYYAIFISLLFVCVFLLAIHNQTFSKIVSRPSLLYVGAISYPLYLVHENMIVGGAIGLHHQFPQLPAIFYPIPFIALAIVVAHFITILEPRVRKILQPSLAKLTLLTTKTSRGS